MPRSTTTIDDAGFDKLYTGRKETVDSGRVEPESRDTQPERSTERISGFETVSPFDITDAGTDRSDSGGKNAGGDSGTDYGSEPRRRGRPPGSRNKEAVSK